MARIENFPQSLLDEHARWHMNMPMGMNSQNEEDFLLFHRTFLNKALEWYHSQELDPSLVTPWTSIPEEIKNSPWWSRRLQAAEDRVVNDLESFDSLQELGNFLQNSNLHGAVHRLGSRVYNDRYFGLIFLSPRSTYFYKWHGLIDQWARELESRSD